ncbi:MAG: hypothetical protein JO314_14020, partial [Acidobacteria bacterium]|nr:hypothetical protein [Acidobacteriota bacterium]
AAGPERRVFETTPEGRERLADSLEAEHWVSDRVYQPFLIWLALSWQARGNTFKEQLAHRRDRLSKRLVAERETLDSVRREVGHEHHEAVWILELKIDQTELELAWIERVIANAGKRSHAKRADYPDE